MSVIVHSVHTGGDLAKFGVDKNWYKFLNSMAKFGTKFLDCAQGKVTTALFIC